MKHLVFLLLCYLPVIVLAQDKRDYTQEEIKKDKDYIALQAKIKPLEDKLKVILSDYRQAVSDKSKDAAYRTALENDYKTTTKELITLLQTFITKNPKSYISLLVLEELSEPDSGVDSPTLSNLYNGLSAPIKKTELGKALENKIFSAARTAIGAVAPNFTQKDPNGKPVNLSDFRGKYVLIDFWASWCGPCRKENPTIVKAYEQFKNKNLEILGVSLDNANAKNAWLNAIEKDGLIWTQVSDLQGWKNQVALLYGVKVIPQNYLIDPKGVIIAKNLRGEELIRTLSQLLK